MLIMTSFHLDLYFVSSFFVCLLALTRYFMIKQILNIADLVHAFSVFLLELLQLRINYHRKGEIDGSYQCFIYLSCAHLPS